MARCALADGRCGRIGKRCAAGRCVARAVRRLRERRWRDKLGLFVAEGEDLVDAAREAGLEPVELLVAGETVEPALLAEVSALGHPPRVLAVFRYPEPAAGEPGLLLWRIADPGNVGTLIRSADAFGVAVALSDGCADPYGPKALRAAMGSTFRVPLVPFEIPPRAVALVAHGAPPLAGDYDAVVVGNEREGLPPEVVERCEASATIPLPGRAESLNVAAAGAVALYELAKRS